MTMESITERYYTQYHPLPVITSVPKSRDLLIFMISEDKLDIVNEACIRINTIMNGNLELTKPLLYEGADKDDVIKL
ncbi:ankyrin repeat protein [Magpiepox virus]|nr:ankyrin repeat protein [Magpiepox virus]